MTFENDMAKARDKLRSGQYKHAFRAAKSAMKKNPRVPFAANLAGIALGGMGNHREAANTFAKALKLDPDFHDARKNLAQSLILLGKAPAALTLLDKLVAQTPDDADAWYLLAQVNAKMGKSELAENAATKSIELMPKQSRGYNLRALLRDKTGRTDEALEDYQTSLELNPNDVDTLVNISLPLARQSRHREALQAASRAVELAPDKISARLQLATHLVAQGDYGGGIAQYQHVLKLDPKQSDALERLAPLLTQEQNQALDTLARTALKSAPKMSQARAKLLFARAEIAVQANRNFEADGFLESANACMAAILPYDAKADSRQMAKILGQFKDPLQTQPAKSGVPTPIYIVGLPRSGTSLCEAILGVHPQVAPLGERIAAGFLLKDVIDSLISFDKTSMQAFVDADQRLLPDLPVGTVNYTDKMPENYRLLGYLATAYPKCRVINLRRDPRDIALSMWRGNFSGSALSYTYSLAAMAHRFNLYAKAMKHWHKIMPGLIMDLRYEDMVSDIDHTSRNLAAFCGVNWVPDMARPDLNPDQVLTMSATQLRQPVHKRSIEKWRKHQTALAPFVENLDPNLWPEIA